MSGSSFAKSAHAWHLEDRQLIPVGRYFEEEFFNLENQHLWSRAWQMACRLEMIPDVGDWVEYTILGKSVIIVRTDDGVRAFHNHCRHRGVPLVASKSNAAGASAHGNCEKMGFICPFHGWRWNMQGENTFVYGRDQFDEKLLDPEALKLRPVRCETWGGCAFINFDDDATPYRDLLGSRAEGLEARNMETLRSEWWIATVLPANWKIAMEAFQEGYHVMATHPQLQRATPAMYNARYGHDTDGLGAAVDPNMTARDAVVQQFEQMELLSAGMAGLVHKKEVAIARSCLDVELPEDPQEAVVYWYGVVQDAITRELRACGEDVPDLKKVMAEKPLEAVEFLFPNYFLLTYFTGMSSYRVRPLGPESCLFEIWSLTNFPKGQEPAPPMEPTVLPYNSKDFPLIPQQDYSNIPIQQKGLHSGGLEHLRLAKNVEGLIANYHQVIDGFIGNADQDKLNRAILQLDGNFDGQIRDFGF